MWHNPSIDSARVVKRVSYDEERSEVNQHFTQHDKRENPKHYNTFFCHLFSHSNVSYMHCVCVYFHSSPIRLQSLSDTLLPPVIYFLGGLHLLFFLCLFISEWNLAPQQVGRLIQMAIRLFGEPLFKCLKKLFFPVQSSFDQAWNRANLVWWTQCEN